MFKEERNELLFEWDMIGDLAEGRPNMGALVDVSVYRLMQSTLRDVMIKDIGIEKTDKIFYDAGKHAGTLFCRNLLDTNEDFNTFVTKLQDLLQTLKIGILRIEKSDLEKMHFTITVAEDLDCSGLPVSDETICTYDEGFLAGVLAEYTGDSFIVKEVDCWCSGDRVCRFDVKKAG